MARWPLENVRVLDFSQNWAGPMATKILGDMGAEVIKVESITRYDTERGPVRPRPVPGLRLYPDGVPGEHPWNRAGRFNEYNRSKYGITLDLKTPDGMGLIQELVKVSDVVIENFKTGTMEHLGLGYDALKALRPDIIYISMPFFGNRGPYAQYTGWGTIQEALSGLPGITGYPGGPPMQTGVYYGDPTSGVFGATAVFIALWHRRRTGKGQFIDFAQQEGLTALLPQILYEHLFNQRTLGPMGNKHPSMAPHGCYRCAGEDSWVVIAVASDREWQALCQALGQPTLARDPRFNTTLARLRNREELDQVIEDWTRQRDHYEVMHTLQKGGVAAEAVLANNEVLSDPHYQARGFFEEVPHPEAGTHPLVGVSWKMSKTPGKVRMAAPCLGQHNELILGELLGLSEEELASLAQKQVIGKIPIGSHPYVAR